MSYSVMSHFDDEGNVVPGLFDIVDSAGKIHAGPLSKEDANRICAELNDATEDDPPRPSRPRL